MLPRPHRLLALIILGGLCSSTAVALPGGVWPSAPAGFPDNSADIAVSVQAVFEPVPATPGDVVRLVLQGKVEQGKFIYSALGQDGSAPPPTRISLSSPWILAVGDLRESPPEIKLDGAFNTLLRIHQGAFWITRDYRVLKQQAPAEISIPGKLVYRVCDGRVCSAEKQLAFQAHLALIPGKAGEQHPAASKK